MTDLANKDVLVIGFGGRGQAACDLLHQSGARVSAVDSADTPALRDAAQRLRPLGVDVRLGATSLALGDAKSKRFDLAVLSPAVRPTDPLVKSMVSERVPLIGELELGFQQAKCLCIGIGGTNGKSTTASLVERILAANHRKIILAGHRARPICSVVQQSRDLDFMILQVNAFQLETTDTFHPAVSVLMNVTPDYHDRFPQQADYISASARLFRKQEAFDWAIIQSEALLRLKELNLPIPAKTITFSSHDSTADIYLDRGLIISRMPNWTGPLLDIDHCQIRGPHNAENLMAALAVGHALRLPLEAMVDPLKTFAAGPHRFQLVAEINGVQYINDSKATNVDALHKALLAARTAPGRGANIWLIAGGEDHEAVEFHDVGPTLSKRVRQAYLIGEASEKIRASWSLFTACKLSATLLEAITEATHNATSGDVVLLSPGCSSFDLFRNYQHRGDEFCAAVKSISRGAPAENPNLMDKK
jgi:UDP-N-acetylmuramoylalanine--D-glutamate ligase